MFIILPRFELTGDWGGGVNPPSPSSPVHSIVTPTPPPNPLVPVVLLTLPVNFSQFEPWMLQFLRIRFSFRWTFARPWPRQVTQRNTERSTIRSDIQLAGVNQRTIVCHGLSNVESIQRQHHALIERRVNLLMAVISLPRIVTIQSKVHLMTGLFKPDYAAYSDPQMNLASVWLTRVLLARVLIYTTVQSTSHCRAVNSFPQFPIQIFSRRWHAPNQSPAGCSGSRFHIYALYTVPIVYVSCLAVNIN